MKRPKNGYTMKQYAYAKNALGATKQTKKAIALSVGYSPSVASSVKKHIEDTEGFQNAMIGLAAKAGNLVMAAMHEYEARGLSSFSNKDLNGAMSAISAAFERFAKAGKADEPSETASRLRGIILQNVQHQTINEAPKSDTQQKVKKVK